MKQDTDKEAININKFAIKQKQEMTTSNIPQKFQFHKNMLMQDSITHDIYLCHIDNIELDFD